MLRSVHVKRTGTNEWGEMGQNLEVLSEHTFRITPKGKQNSEKIQRIKIRLALSSYVIKPCKWNQKITY